MDDAQEPSITLHPHSRRVQAVMDGTPLAVTTRAIELRERGYTPRQHLPRDDVRMDLLTSSETVTHCPLKGDASYFLFGERKDMAWSYQQPVSGIEKLAGKLVFYNKEPLFSAAKLAPLLLAAELGGMCK